MVNADIGGGARPSPTRQRPTGIATAKLSYGYILDFMYLQHHPIPYLYHPGPYARRVRRGLDIAGISLYK